MMMKAWIWSAILIPTAPTNLSYQHLWKIWYWYAINQVKGPNDAKTVAEKKKGFILIFSSLSERIFFGCSNPVFIFSIQPISCLPLFSGLVFAYSFFSFFNLYFSIKNSTQLRVCFLMGQVSVSGTHIFDFFKIFLWKYHCIYF